LLAAEDCDKFGIDLLALGVRLNFNGRKIVASQQMKLWANSCRPRLPSAAVAQLQFPSREWHAVAPELLGVSRQSDDSWSAQRQIIVEDAHDPDR
jgi:hypothetical protein